MNMITSMDEACIARVYEVEKVLLTMKQAEVVTDHLIHSGMYARTISMQPDQLLTGALIKIDTMLIINGDVSMSINGKMERYTGYVVIAAMAGRKQVFLAHEYTTITMLFKTNSTDVEAIEQEFTDEADRLMSRSGKNIIRISGV